MLVMVHFFEYSITCSFLPNFYKGSECGQYSIPLFPFHHFVCLWNWHWTDLIYQNDNPISEFGMSNSFLASGQLTNGKFDSLLWLSMSFLLTYILLLYPLIPIVKDNKVVLAIVDSVGSKFNLKMVFNLTPAKRQYIRH